ncbi:hypothetical protein TeGR_g293 [Tetraparma gracilis]|jgi:RNA polymerase sigma factor (sigma-70 family)|uniref:RNA polymerase sigma-70 domain-containing protein n=1 Tax=Tetraparma gracilis TaxID=2962635 RepID=A0ABQ6MDV1_9STRA|nr:hypothetical protein TeGR_g293 [Tetraparma gracilis]
MLTDASRGTLSIDAEKNVKTKGGTTSGEVKLADTVQDDGVTPSEYIEGVALSDDLRKLLSTLSPRERDVVTMRFGLETGEVATLEEIGNKFDVTRERIRQIEARALHKLKQPYRNHKLREYVDGA